MSIKRHQPGKLLSSAVEHNGVVYLAGMVADNLHARVHARDAPMDHIYPKLDAEICRNWGYERLARRFSKSSECW